MNVPLLDLKAQYQAIKPEIDAAVAEVFASQYFVLGPKVKECEEAIAEYCGSKFGVGVTSGTDALIVSLMAEDIGPGDEVITTPYTFFATAGSIARVGATPVFVDIDPISFNLNPELIESRITDKTRAIIPVHLYGQMAPMEAILRIARDRGVQSGLPLTVIEDAAQAIGAVDGGRRAGSVGDYGCFSFFPSKNLGAAGEGGMVVTNDAKRAEKLACLRVHGAETKYYHKFIGGNFRLDALQAAVVLAKLPHLDKWTAGRQANAARYARLFEGTGLVERGDVVLPAVMTDRHIFNQYVIRVGPVSNRSNVRDELRTFLNDRRIGHEVYYPVPLHLQDCFAYLGYREGEFPQSEQAAKETIALPIYPELSDEQARLVVDSVAAFYS